MNNKENVIARGVSGIVIALAVLVILAQTGAATQGEGEIIRTSSAIGVPFDVLSAANEPVTFDWYLDSNLTYQQSSYVMGDNRSYTWNNISDIGYHNITFVVSDQAGNTNFTTLLVYVGTKIIVSRGTEIVNITTLSVLAAPGERFNLTTKISPAVIEQPKMLIFEGTSTGKLLIEKNEEGEYSGEWLINSSNSTSLIARFPANSTNNGTFLIGLYRPIAEDEEGNSIPVNIVNAEFSSYPRYDINGDGVVNGADLTILRLHYNENTSGMDPKPRYDINGDGVVNGADLTILRLHYNEEIPTVN